MRRFNATHSLLIQPSYLLRTLILLTAASLITLAGCDTHLKNEPPLHRAAYKGDVDTLTQLLKEGHKVDSRNSEGATPLHWAAFKGHVHAAALLIKSGADVNARTKKGSTPLRLATTHKHDDVAKLLRQYGGKIEGQ